jgi:hypothetical protein
VLIWRDGCRGMPCDPADDDHIPALGIRDDPPVAARALGSGCEHYQGVIDSWQWHMRASRDCDRVTLGGSARAGASARHHHPVRTMTRRERIILSRGERAFESHDVVLPSARTWPGSSGLGWVPPWLEAWPVTTRGSPRDKPRNDPRNCTDGPPEQRKRKSRWVNARRAPKACSLVRREGQSRPGPRCRRGQGSSPAATDTPKRLLEKVSDPVRPVTRRVMGPADGRPGHQPRAESGPVLTGSSLCHPQTLGWGSPGAYCVQFAFVGGPTSAHSAA